MLPYGTYAATIENGLAYLLRPNDLEVEQYTQYFHPADTLLDALRIDYSGIVFLTHEDMRKEIKDRRFAALIHILYAAPGHRLYAKTNPGEKEWKLALTGTGWDANYQVFVFDNGTDSIRRVHSDDLRKDVLKALQIDLADTLEKWEGKDDA